FRFLVLPFSEKHVPESVQAKRHPNTARGEAPPKRQGTPVEGRRLGKALLMDFHIPEAIQAGGDVQAFGRCLFPNRERVSEMDLCLLESTLVQRDKPEVLERHRRIQALLPLSLE